MLRELSNRSSATGQISLKEAHPEIARQWHPRLNGGKLSRHLPASSRLPYRWKCPKGPDHEWVATISARIKQGKDWCPACAGRLASVTNSLAARAPQVAAQWAHDLNNPSAGPGDGGDSAARPGLMPRAAQPG